MLHKAQRRLKEIHLIKQQLQDQPQKSHEQDILQKHLQIDRLTHAMNYFASLVLFMHH